MKNRTFAIAGIGNISSRHIESIKEVGGEIIATYDPDRSRESTVDSFEELLKTDAEWIVILTPNKLHLEQAKMALAAGKKVIVEKPPALSWFDLWSFDIEDEIYTISQLRYMQSVKDLRMKVMRDKGYDVWLDIVANRDPIYLANWRGKQEWSGGLLYINGIHYFDVLTWIFGALKKIHYIRWFGDFRVQGHIELEKCTLRFNIEIATDKPNHKSLMVGKKTIDLAAGFFELHGESYKDIMNGGGIHPLELNKAYELIDTIYAKQ